MYMGLRNIGLVGGVGASSQTDLQRLLALSPSLLIWPAMGAGWQGTSGGTLAASGQPLGLGADLSQLQGKTLSEWLASAPELVTNGGFSNGTTEWSSVNAIISEAAGVATVENSGATAGALFQNLTTVFGRVYQVTFTLSAFSGAATSRISANNGTSPSYNGSQIAANYGAGTNTYVFTAAGSTSSLGFYVNSTTAGYKFSVDNISVRELPGNHLRAGTWASPSDAARGTFQNNAINFDGVDDYYSLLNAISITTNMTVVRAFKRASAGINSIGLASSVQPYDLWWLSSNNINVALNGSTNQLVASAQTQTGSFVGTTRRNSTNERGRLNGVDLTPVSAAAVAGSLVQLGLRAATYNSGEISFLALFPTELTGADLAFVEQIAASTNGAVLA